MLETLENIDRSLLLAINGCNSPLLDIVFWQISAGWVFFPLWIFLAVYIYKVRKIKFLLTGVVCVAFVILFSDQSSNLMKKTYKRYRPTHNLEIKEKIHVVNNYYGGQFGFFSGHAANNFGAAIFLFLCLNWVKSKYRYALFLWPLLVGYSRAYLGVHYPSDILIGALDGMLWGFVFYKVFDYLIKKWNVETV